MKDEIKEILDDLRTYKDRYEYFLFNNLSFSDRDYKAKILLDYITNLQEENERLKTEKQEEYNRFNLMVKFRDKALTRELIYKSRNEKAIEYIKEAIENDDYLEDDISTDMNEANYDKYINSNKLLNILQGEDKE